MKYVNQKKYPHLLYTTRQLCDKEEDRERGKATTIFTSGCGLCSAVMVAHRLIPNCEFELDDAIALSYDCQANLKIGTNYKRFAPAFAEKLSLDYEMTDDPERLRYCLRTGGAAVVGITGDREDHVGVYSTGGHYIAAISEERDGRIATLDPSFRPDKYDKEGCKGLVEIKSGVLTLSRMDVLMKDTENPKPNRFFLFWRK
jgi:hypothetical protein